MNEMIDEAQKLLDEAEALKKLGARPQPVPDSSKMTAHVQIDFKIQNIVGSCDVKFPIRLEGLAYSHGAFSSYEPELFPGLIYRMKQPKIVPLIFVSGKIVLTGAKVRDETYTAFENIYPVLSEFTKVQQWCVICQMEYRRGDLQMTLPCKHVYHASCVTRWLSINKVCPVCFAEVPGEEPKRQ